MGSTQHYPKTQRKMSSKAEKRAAAKEKLKEKFNKAGNMLTKSKWFQKKIDAAWAACDPDNSGSFNKDGLYTGIIYIHLKIAEKAGASACHPPTREMCDKLFDAVDADDSGSVDKEEFSNIAVTLCGHLLKRMVVYYGVMIVLVPMASVAIVGFGLRFTRIPKETLMEKVAEHVTSGFMCSQVLPYFWAKIDGKTEEKMIEKGKKKDE